MYSAVTRRFYDYGVLGMLDAMLKRSLDILVSVVLLAVLSPLLLLISVLIWCQMGAPVLFRQTRVGLNESHFELMKFRSMKDAVDANGGVLSDNERLTALGKMLRSTSIDELPTLWLVLTGRMSLVGPRPLLVEYVPLYNDRQRRRHDVKPGVTGWAQVNGRNAISWEKKFQHDVWYVENHTFLLDVRILFMTAARVAQRKDIDSPTHGIMERFRGSTD